jgi:hypothetical protein
MSGLSIINRLHPIAFDWKANGKRDLGFGAEEVEKIDPLLVTYNNEGMVDGVKYDRIGVVLVNAVKEQRAEIELLKERLKKQEALVNTMKEFLCKRNKRSAICKK